MTMVCIPGLESIGIDMPYHKKANKRDRQHYPEIRHIHLSNGLAGLSAYDSEIVYHVGLLASCSAAAW